LARRRGGGLGKGGAVLRHLVEFPAAALDQDFGDLRKLFGSLQTQGDAVHQAGAVIDVSNPREGLGKKLGDALIVFIPLYHQRWPQQRNL